VVPKGDPNPYARIKLVCLGDTLSATAAILDSSYSVTIKPTPPSRADFVFTKGAHTTEYVYSCSDGLIVGGLVIPERP